MELDILCQIQEQKILLLSSKVSLTRDVDDEEWKVNWDYLSHEWYN